MAVFTPFGAGNWPLTGQALSGKTAVPNMVELMMILCFRPRRA